MGGTFPVCPFCHKICSDGGGVKDHIKAKHSEQYREWITSGQKPYWMYDADGKLKYPD